MITQQEMERLATIGQLCWDCDNAPTFEDNNLCEDCLWVECGWCREEATGERARKGCKLCAMHNKIRKETL